MKRSTHVCICYVAYKIYKELERIIKEKNIDLSVGKVLDAVKTITTISVQMSENEEIYTNRTHLSVFVTLDTGTRIYTSNYTSSLYK